MPDSSHEQQEKRRREFTEADRRLLEVLRQESTPEALHDEWDRVRGIGTRGSSSAPACWRSEWVELWAAMTSARVPQGTAIAVVALIIGIAAWGVIQPQDLIFQTPAAWVNANGQRLPDTLRIRLRKTEVSLQGNALAMTSRLGSGLRSGSQVTSYEVTFQGEISNGVPVTFRGTLLLTNAPGVVEIRRQRDVTGGLLLVELLIGTNVFGTNAQPYLPK